ncbi:MAG: YcxB family protein [Ruminococcaceae bacterium]|nr:YcxB family protein [Oscillospiraceae bacterium]
MEITAHSQYNLKTVTALSRLMMYKKRNPRKSILIFGCAWFVLLLLNILLGILDEPSVLAYILLILLGSLAMFGYFFAPKIQYKNMGAFKDGTHTFVFYDEKFTVTSQTASSVGTSDFNYATIQKIMETTEYLFLFPNKNQSFIVDKSTLSEQDMNTLRVALVSKIGSQYIICNY